MSKRNTNVEWILANLLRTAHCRHMATATGYVPPASVQRGEPTRPQMRREILPKSPNTYTGRSGFFDAIDNLESAANLSRQALKKLQLSPLPEFALQSLPPAQPAWKDKQTLSTTLSVQLSPSKYSRMLKLLKQLDEYKRVAVVAGYESLAESISEVLEVFERDDKEAYLSRGKSRPVKFDEYGRSYTVGRRKESGARVWVIPTRPVEEPASVISASKPAGGITPGSLVASLPGLETKTAAPKVPISQIIINNASLAEYLYVQLNSFIGLRGVLKTHPIFSQNTADRERVLRPLKVSGLLGAFNVFAIARGGGTTGQSGAISLGIAKALAAHVPDVAPILRKSKLVLRDPRMVERKKPGLAKARKAYAWVRR
ncbi:hypothetical protein PHLGIDRAFT_23540 [Phlebiopsis gigantea 11061_1 CR5-6]|uniref:Uncharacterized protein n=1 Tax=Phlebiopsis gigantea (strain 11061_1 CR5-6) TaxID=745531 RepID=A0A0C3S0I4_PHLG1|nr:hypothetical protein PHLGIDRAFT_23540 [Phlebiopsis gigantea 11061_1 CR5-6]